MDNPKKDISDIIKARWSVEVYHRELKQTCGIENCQARTGRAQRNHICLSILTWLDKHKKRINENLTFYQQNWDIIKNAISGKIKLILNYN